MIDAPKEFWIAQDKSEDVFMYTTRPEIRGSEWVVTGGDYFAIPRASGIFIDPTKWNSNVLRYTLAEEEFSRIMSIHDAVIEYYITQPGASREGFLEYLRGKGILPPSEP